MIVLFFASYFYIIKATDANPKPNQFIPEKSINDELQNDSYIIQFIKQQINVNAEALMYMENANNILTLNPDMKALSKYKYVEMLNKAEETILKNKNYLEAEKNQQFEFLKQAMNTCKNSLALAQTEIKQLTEEYDVYKIEKTQSNIITPRNNKEPKFISEEAESKMDFRLRTSKIAINLCAASIEEVKRTKAILVKVIEAEKRAEKIYDTIRTLD
ncbi:hypothetical protein EDEG_00156, partial [Edhazardia aedis USNM 41457]